MTTQNPKTPKRPVWGSMLFMVLYALGIWRNAQTGNTAFLLLWSLLFAVNAVFLVIRLVKTFGKP